MRPIPCSMIIQHLLILSVCSLSVLSYTLPVVTSDSSLSSNGVAEWTAMGDSYAAGIGAGALPQGPDPDHCFRCGNSYPSIMQSGPGSLQPSPGRFNFVACSGAKFEEIATYQLLDRAFRGRPAWGNSPEFVTITMGGNDIGILPLVLTCIYSVPIFAKSCDAVIQRGFDILDTQDFKAGLFAVIKRVQDKGRRKYGQDFHVFVTGYAQLFNSERAQCNQVTFRQSGVVLPAQFLTQERRKKMNDLAVALNHALETAVGLFNSRDVTFVDYDHLFESHRFCDRDEPNVNDDETWFFALGTTSDPINQVAVVNEVPGANETENPVARSLIRKAVPHGASPIEDERTGTLRSHSSKESRDITIPRNVVIVSNITGEVNAGPLARYSRVFHPKSRGHQAIRGAILEAINSVLLSRSARAANASLSTS